VTTHESLVTTHESLVTTHESLVTTHQDGDLNKMLLAQLKMLLSRLKTLARQFKMILSTNPSKLRAKNGVYRLIGALKHRACSILIGTGTFLTPKRVIPDASESTWPQAG
jgi:hypothetical protein